MYTADCTIFRVVLPLELACRQLYQRYGASANLASLLDHAACTLGERTTPVSSVPLAPVSAPSAAELVDNFSLHRLPQLYAELARSHNLAVVVEPPAAYKRTRSRKLPTAMSALHEFNPVADATSYLADDIPVPLLPSIRRTQPNPEPATATSTAKGKERARSPAVKTESATACDPPPALSRRPQPAAQEASASAMQPIATPVGPAFPANQAPFVNLAARAETLHLSPHTSSIEYLASRHPDATNDNDSTDDEPSASKRPRLVSPTPSPQAPSPDYLALTPSEIDRLLHDARPFRYRFVYTPDHIRGIADDILRELSAFLSFYAPASEQEAAARIYLTAPSSPTSTGDSRSLKYKK
ncbi:hypothetical protein PCASD_11690 [Puccinia coronata f. sp. avenae]|uniref:Uncharacterized protein n=1 Tax=Puccinia coronata f. sp. avenae TaxID=200324 RepID=A0A2N5UEG2_9BASI|nr:hypothetical protein PCASD_11690 [Puccinia coronata f. sp. avenae]